MLKKTSASEYILFFQDIDSEMISLVGGKGVHLGGMMRAGFPVPRGFCLTTKVYDEFAAGLELDGLDGEEARKKLAGRHLSAACLEKMQEVLGQFSENTFFSVRSSATAEDLSYASFAGQQDTYLNVGIGDLAEAVKNCFISLYTDRAVSYRRQNEIFAPGMAVVVQQMVCSEASGVMFSADPVSGRRTLLVIDAVFGLGEAVVSGLVSPDHIEYDKIRNTVTKENIACKDFAICPAAGGGTWRKELKSREAVLSARQIHELASLGKRLEEQYGCPQDVEWAIEEGKIYCLQARAITSLYPAPVFTDGKFHFLHNLGCHQMYTKAMPMMALDCLMGAINPGEPDLLKYKQSFIYEVGQHCFVDISQMFRLKFMRDALMERMLPVTDPLAVSAVRELLERKPGLSRPSLKLTGLLIKSDKSRHMHHKEPKALASETRRRMETWSRAVIEAFRNAKTESEAMRTLFRNVRVSDIIADPYKPMMHTGVHALRSLERIEDKMGCRGRWTKELQVGNEGNIVTEMGLHMGDLADFVAADACLRELLSAGGERLNETLLAREDAFGKSYREFMRLYGFRCAGELDISQPRWEEDPTPLIAQILTMARNKEQGSHRVEYKEKNEKAVRAGQDMLRTVKGKLGIREAEKVSRCLAQFQNLYPMREHFKYYWMRNFGEARRLLLRLGVEMARKGQLEKNTDIMHLHMMEVYQALESGDDLRLLVSQRKLEFERVSRMTPPRIITSEGEVLMGGLSGEGLPENALAGAGVSPGIAEGVAKVVIDPKDAVMEKGEILIAPFSDPGWTPLFVDAAAVVMEIGGMLTHGAVVAREYGIPCVVGVMDATKKIRTGQKVRVDGTSGYVEVKE